ncbi:DUF6230 family protein [Streptomyces sp. Li-HN-5-11]|uniref:DUF6230 family protein n=1 Tax=Streptomyces sp. Li-HN-5-11 TaxID=3075432 RepID=UPI0028AB0242|nr:DUF6230 family protein [Streptomyces sp. Li-HN-5-11]WNM30325.1 DUF6230 family protein [Streptomyces sp. Li-HN-5-11]
MESQVRGGTRWKRFAVVMVPSVAATAAIGVALAQGALAASFSVSGQEFKVTADQLDGTGFSQYGALDSGYTLSGDKTAHAVAVSAFNEAYIQKMCQSVVTPNLPFVGTVTLKLTAGDSSDKSGQVYAKNLYIDVDDLGTTSAEFGNIDIGVAAGDMKGGPGPGMKGGKEQANPYGFGQQAETAKLTGVQQTAWATTAGTFKLPGLHMSLSKGSGKGVECY